MVARRSTLAKGRRRSNALPVGSPTSVGHLHGFPVVTTGTAPCPHCPPGSSGPNKHASGTTTLATRFDDSSKYDRAFWTTRTGVPVAGSMPRADTSPRLSGGFVRLAFLPAGLHRRVPQTRGVGQVASIHRLPSARGLSRSAATGSRPSLAGILSPVRPANRLATLTVLRSSLDDCSRPVPYPLPASHAPWNTPPGRRTSPPPQRILVNTSVPSGTHPPASPSLVDSQKPAQAPVPTGASCV